MVKALLAGGDGQSAIATGMPAAAILNTQEIQPKPEREDILLYIDRIRSLFTDSWKAKYRQTWGEIIDHPTVAAVIYNKGRQVDTTFNRNLVGQMINYLGHRGMIERWNATKITMKLENTVEHSVREALRKDPPANIMTVLKAYTEQDAKNP